MKSTRIAIAVLFLILPIMGRTLFYYRGIYQREAPIATPDFSGEKMPQPGLSTPIPDITLPGTSTSPVILIDMTHTNGFLLSEIEPLTRNLASLGAEVRVTGFAQPLWDDLKSAQALVVICPTSEFTSGEIDAVEKFVARGGRLLMITDPTRDVYLDPGVSEKLFDGVDIANILLRKFGISFIKDYAYNLLENEANFRNVISNEISTDPAMKEIKQVVFYSTHTLQTSSKGLLFGDKNTFSSLTDAGGKLPLAAISADGNAIAIGDMTFMTVPYITVADNQVLAANLAGFLVGGNRQYGLEDAPYLFKRPVSILKSDNLKMDTDLLDTVSNIQKHLDRLQIFVQLDAASKEGNDSLILGTYSSTEKKFLNPYLAGFDLIFLDEEFDAKSDSGTDTSLKKTETTKTPPLTSTIAATAEPTGEPGQGTTPSTVIVPGFGRMKADEVGLILFKSNPGKNTIILLAGSGKGLKDLSTILADGMNGCTIQGNLAACTLSSNGVSAESDYNPPGIDFPSAETVSPAGTATPSG